MALNFLEGDFKILNGLIKIKKETAVAIGVFDGVHLGHRAVILNAVFSGLFPVVLTFNFEDEFPNSKKNFCYILPETEKFKLIFKLGVKLIVRLNFKKIKNLGFEEFFKKVVVERLNAKLVVCGENLKFGKNKEGDVFSLRNLAKNYDVKVSAIKLLNFLNEPISSTRIRKALKEGDFKNSNKMLGYWFYVKINADGLAFKNNFAVVTKIINKKHFNLNNGFYLALVKQKQTKSLAMVRVKELGNFKILVIKIKFNNNFKFSSFELVFIKKIWYYFNFCYNY